MGCVNSKARVHAAQVEPIKLPSSCFQNVVFFSIGDIEGQDKKLYNIIEFIKSNPTREFVFLGDLFDDISWTTEKRIGGLNCIKLLDENGLLEGGMTLKELSDFKNIRFEINEYKNIKNRIKFIVGNAECDALNDILGAIDNNKPDADGYYSFECENAAYSKKFTKEELSLIYKYLTCCNGALSYEISQNKTLWIRHAANTFRTTAKFVDQNSKIKPSSETPIVCGHNKNYGIQEDFIYMNDTSLNESDCRINAIEIKDSSVQAESLLLDFEFKKIERRS